MEHATMTMLLVICVFGLIFGSFISALVWRIHAKKKWWGSERSMCPNCKHQLAAKDLVPLFSWLSTSGKCRYCTKPISVLYPFTELVTALFFAGSYIFWPYELMSIWGVIAFISWLAVVVALTALLVYDMRWMLLPNKLVLVSGIFSLLTILLIAALSHQVSMIIYASLAGMSLFGLFYGLFVFSKGRWIGGGDVKLALPLGFVAGTPLKAILLIFIASFIGTFIAVPLIITKKLTPASKVPFGPLLIVAAIIVFLFGDNIIDWYMTTVLFM